MSAPDLERRHAISSSGGGTTDPASQLYQEWKQSRRPTSIPKVPKVKRKPANPDGNQETKPETAIIGGSKLFYDEVTGQYRLAPHHANDGDDPELPSAVATKVEGKLDSQDRWALDSNDVAYLNDPANHRLNPKGTKSIRDPGDSLIQRLRGKPEFLNPTDMDPITFSGARFVANADFSGGGAAAGSLKKGGGLLSALGQLGSRLLAKSVTYQLGKTAFFKLEITAAIGGQIAKGTAAVTQLLGPKGEEVVVQTIFKNDGTGWKGGIEIIGGVADEAALVKLVVPEQMKELFARTGAQSVVITIGEKTMEVTAKTIGNLFK